MKESAKQRVYNKLKELTENGSYVTAKEISDQLFISRQNVSHYLSRLLETGQIEKKNGKPVYWKVKVIEEEQLDVSNYGDFFEVIGVNGSLKEIVQQCIAAVKYPPNGLSVLLNGDSGVGKSFLAKKIYDFAKASGAIGLDAPFIILNCADYADNPELLSATLFGYKKGAFTGADKDVDGLIKNADAGYLFLDEVHRLSHESQEKLFLFMDTGKYRPVGEYKSWSQSQVRFIFATTERKENILLDTFTRRIQLKLTLPSFEERPLNEKLSLIINFFQNESDILQKNISVKKEVFSYLLQGSFVGNIGRLKNIIKIACANVYSFEKSETLVVDIQDIVMHVTNPFESFVNFVQDDFLIIKNSKIELDLLYEDKWIHYLEEINELISSGNSYENITTVKMIVQKIIKSFKYNTFFTQKNKILKNIYKNLWTEIIEKKYGLKSANPASDLSSLIYMNMNISNVEIDISDSLKILSEIFPRTTYICEQFILELPQLTSSTKEIHQLLLVIILSDYVDESIELKGLLLAHGNGMASSIQSVVNQLCENYIFEAFDMPIESSVKDIVELTKQFLKKQVHFDNLILLVDMGSLNQIYSQIKNDLKGELLLINNLTTSIALDLGLKMSMKNSFNQIAKNADLNYSINVQYHEGFSQSSNIIISCMSGIGISDKLKDIFQRHLENDEIEVYTKEYRELRELIDQNDEKYFDNTKIVITTSNLPGSFSIPHINVYDLLDGTGVKQLEDILNGDLSHQSLIKLTQELVTFFSLEGVANRLIFLNPTIVMQEVETVISKYEIYYNLKLNGRIKLNLYMHTALMLERLFLSNIGELEENIDILNKKEEEFYYVSRSIFQSIERKYNLKVNFYELSLIYELFSPFL